MPKQGKTLKWARLDNAAKIFPPTSHGADTGVFRLSCELTEPVRPDLLQQALDETLLQFPHMLMVMRRGVFWYYLEQTTLHAEVVPETKPPCAPLYEGSQSLLFEVSYWRHKINLEVFHVLADGTGGIAFLRSLLTTYLTLRHPEAGDATLLQAPVSHRRQDSFQKYYRPPNYFGDNGKNRGTSHAYRLRGAKRPDYGISVIEGVCDVQKVLEAAHQYNTTLTAYLAAVLFEAVHDEMYVRHEKKPVVITVPVNLRTFFRSDTTRNFFGTIRVAHNFKENGGAFEGIVQSVTACLAEELKPERLESRMNRLASLEHNPVLRMIPLALKNPVLRVSGDISDWGETMVLSNLGRFRMPESLNPYLKGFSAFMSTNALQLCTSTFRDRLHFGFTSVFDSPDIQRNFFTRLSASGIPIEVRSANT